MKRQRRTFQFGPMYQVIPADSSNCADCEGDLVLLTPRCMTNMPAFFIGRCGFIAEVGVGVVRKCGHEKGRP